MDPKELRGLVEAYSEVYAPEQLDEISAGLAGKVVNARIAATGAASDRAYKHRNPEAMRAAEKASDKEGRARKLAAGVRSRRAKQNEEFELWVNELVEEGHDLSDYTWDEVYEFYLDEASSRDEFTRAAIARNSGRKGGITFEPGPNWDASANRGKGAHISPKQKEKQRRKALRQEELDIFDVVLEFLQVEGYAETLEEAEWLMSNVIDDEAISIILGEEYMDEALTGERYKKVMKKPGGTAYSRKVSADPSKRATRGGRGGESDFGAGDRGSGNKAARRAGTYQEEEFAIDEASSRDEFTRAAIARSSGRKGGITFEPGPNWDASANRGKGAHISPKQKEKQRRKALRQEAFEDWLDEAMTNYEKNRKRAAQRAAARNDARAQGKTGAVPGVGYVTPRKERETWTDESGKTRHAKGL